jgi:hypothetical protein
MLAPQVNATYSGLAWPLCELTATLQNEKKVR